MDGRMRVPECGSERSVRELGKRGQRFSGQTAARNTSGADVKPRKSISPGRRSPVGMVACWQVRMTRSHGTTDRATFAKAGGIHSITSGRQSSEGTPDGSSASSSDTSSSGGAPAPSARTSCTIRARNAPPKTRP